ncbi:hypothetical protein [Acetivibrio clariflavus]|uniref:Flp pilus assembly protein TadB n=1 Tax=Acetivibrio clariflavus (strain DSM 19732 / NBRC 101661 / EBR45) TaxID=720554 RepID=G8LVL0_ACECE|nr:hypothetical protein [Acetivibrio clariflavus]AEV69646.1 hypothetical protein Clocl_3119 [Acetivibrio clariflavus DSM 19732]
MDLNLLFSIGLGLVALVTLNIVLDLQMGSYVKYALIGMVDSLANRNTRAYVKRIKKSKIVRQKEGLIAKYNNIVENLIFDFNLPLTLEGFNSFICIVFAIMVLLVVLFLKNITLSAFVSISILVGAITFFTMQSRQIKSAKIEHIMDAEDILCPLAREGVLVAIKKVLESDEYLHHSIRPYFVQFVENYENHGYSFRRAMEVLNKQLGPKFDNFAKKAIIFEYNERKGMADVFLDIVDENAALREINARKNRIFKKMNMDFLIKTSLIVIFIMYSMTIKEIRDFLINNDLGRFVNTLAIVSICLGFARCQALQGDIGKFGGDK